MKKIVVILLGSLLFVFASCGSKAPEETTEEVSAPVTTEVVEETDETEEVVETEVVEEAEEETATDESGDENGSVEEALALLDESRNAAIASGAEEWGGDLFQELEDRYAELMERAENGENVSEEAKQLARLYGILGAYSNAQQAKEKIDENDLSEYDQANYDDGVLCLEQLEEMFEEGSVDADKLSELAEKSYAYFNKVIQTAYKKLAKDAREKAFAAKRNADSVKAGVSQKERYKECTEAFQKGDTLYGMQDPEDAFRLYVEAWEGYDGLYKEVSEKRAAALAAIEAAKARVAESESVAVQADLEAPIKDENQEGIEDEDAVLLEEDEYDDPADAEADIAESIDDDEEDEELEAESEEDSEEEDE